MSDVQEAARGERGPQPRRQPSRGKEGDGVRERKRRRTLRGSVYGRGGEVFQQRRSENQELVFILVSRILMGSLVK